MYINWRYTHIQRESERETKTFFYFMLMLSLSWFCFSLLTCNTLIAHIRAGMHALQCINSKCFAFDFPAFNFGVLYLLFIFFRTIFAQIRMEITHTAECVVSCVFFFELSLLKYGIPIDCSLLCFFSRHFEKYEIYREAFSRQSQFWCLTTNIQQTRLFGPYMGQHVQQFDKIRKEIHVIFVAFA